MARRPLQSVARSVVDKLAVARTGQAAFRLDAATDRYSLEVRQDGEAVAGFGAEGEP